MINEPNETPGAAIESSTLLGFLDVVTDADVAYRPKRIIVPPKHHEEYRDWYRKFVNSYRNADLSTYNCVTIELSVTERDLIVSYGDIKNPNVCGDSEPKQPKEIDR